MLQHSRLPFGQPVFSSLHSVSRQVSLHHLLFRRYNSTVPTRFLGLLLATLTLAVVACAAQDSGVNKASPQSAADRNREAQESSSHDTRVDISPPKDDAKNHPASKDAVEDLEGSEAVDASGVQEFHPWNPMKALKSMEVGDFYFKRKNYRAALERYKEALYYKNGDALASYRIAVCQDKLGDKAEARNYYEQYLKILPEGPLAKDAHSSLDRLAKAQ
jgi:tetratricopeptide (TPR) repeat protein